MLHTSLDNRTCGSHGLEFSFYSYQPNQMTVHYTATNYTADNFEAWTEGIFADTFYALSPHRKKQLEQIQTNTALQNEQLMVEPSSSEDLQPNEFLYLISIKTYDELMISQLIGFFTTYFRRLKESGHQAQAFFSHLLFSLNKEKTQLVLEEVIKSPSRIKHQLIAFFKRALKKATTLKWLECRLFLIYTLAQTNRYLVEEEPKSRLTGEAIAYLKKEMETLVNTKTFSIEEKGKIIFTLNACIPYLDHPEMKTVLSLCNHHGKESYQPLEKCNQMAEDCELGTHFLKKESILEGLLPTWVVNHDDSIFKGRNFEATEGPPGIYSFQDAHGTHYQIVTQGFEIYTYKKIGNAWYEYQKSFPCTLPDGHPCGPGGYLNCHGWSRIDQHEVLVQSTHFESTLCRVTKEGFFHPTKPLKLIAHYDSPIVTHFARLAPKKEVLVWKNENNEIVEIDLPRFSLTFTLKEGRWRSPKYPGYFVDQHMVSPSLEPFSHYLILRNQKGKQIAIMPTLGVESQRQQGLQEAKISYTEIRKNNPLITLHLNQQAEVEIDQLPEATIYLIYLSLSKYDYKLAKQLIDKVKKERPEWDNNWLIWIERFDASSIDIEKLDQHPEAIAIRIQLRLLLKELSLKSFKGRGTQWSTGLKRDYFAYLDLKTNIWGPRLSEEEEKKCLSILKKTYFFQGNIPEEFQLDVRRAALGVNKNLPDSKTVLLPPPTLPSNELIIDLHWINTEIERAMKEHVGSPVPIAFITRPGAAFIKNTLYYYAIVRHLPPDHPLHVQLVELLDASHLTVDTKIRAIQGLLRHVMISPSAFPTIEEILQSQRSLHEQFRDKSLPPFKVEKTFSNKNRFTLHRLEAKERVFEPTPAHIHVNSSDPVTVPMPPNLTHLLIEEGFLVQRAWLEEEQELRNDLHVLEEMSTFFTTCQEKGDPTVQEEFKRYIEGIGERQKRIQKKLEQKESSYLISPKKGLSSWLEIQHEKTTEILGQKRQEILQIAHHYPDHLQLEKNGEMLRALTLEELIVHIGTSHDEAIYTSNPSLTHDDVTTLKKRVTEYLFWATHQNQISNMLEKLDHPVELLKLATAQRIYLNPNDDNSETPVEEPHLIVFEYFGQLRLRENQYERLIEIVNSQKDLEQEAGTGFGKSKVLIPLWLFLKSRKENIAMMTLPSSLFTAQYHHLRKVLGRAFDSTIVPLQFDRSKADDPKYLKRLYKKLEDARSHKKILLTTIQSLHGMTSLKLTESLVSGEGPIETLQQRELLKLRGMIATQIASFFDESSICFNIRQRYDYAVGAPSTIDPTLISHTTSLYRELLLDPKLRFNFEFLPSFHKPKHTTPLQENYEAQLLKPFAKKILAKFSVDEHLKNAVLNDLTGDYSPACEEFYRSLAPEKLAEYSFIRKQLTAHMNRTLFRKCNDSYGFLPGTRLAIPCVDGVPKINSEFSAFEDCINFTIQANLKIDFTLHDVASAIDHLKIDIIERKLDRESPQYRFLERLLCRPPMELTHDDYNFITNLINRNPFYKLGWTECYILPQLRAFLKKITSTSFNLVRIPKHIQAASGTPNPDLLPPRLSAKRDLEATIDNWMAFWRHSQVIHLVELTDLLEQSSDRNVLIDVAGTFRDCTIERLVEKIFTKRPHLKGVLFYNDEGHELVYEKDSKSIVDRAESLLETKDLFIFIRKSKAIGTDISDMPAEAKAIVTIEQESQCDFVLQGAGRMRKLKEGQRVDFAIAPKESAMIFGPLKEEFKYLAAHIITNQGKQKGNDIFYALRLYLEDLITASFWAHVKEDVKEVQRLSRAFETFLVKESQTHSLATLRKTRKVLPSPQAVEQLKKELLEPVEKFCTAHPEWAYVFNIDQITQDFTHYASSKKLPSNIMMYEEDSICIVDTNTTHEAEQIEEQDEVVEDDIEFENENINDKVTETPKIRFNPARPLHWDGNHRALLKEEPTKTLLGVSIYYSPNFARVSEDPRENSRVQKPAYQTMVCKDDRGHLQMILLDLHDARILFNKIIERPGDHEQYYMLSNQQVIAFSGQIEKEINPAVKIIQKLYSASQFTIDEKEYISKIEKRQRKQFMKEVERLSQIWPHLLSPI